MNIQYTPKPSICLFTAPRTFLMDRDENHEEIFTWIAVVVVPVLFILTLNKPSDGGPLTKQARKQIKKIYISSYKRRDLNNPLCCHCNSDS